MDEKMERGKSRTRLSAARQNRFSGRGSLKETQVRCSPDCGLRWNAERLSRAVFTSLHVRPPHSALVTLRMRRDEQTQMIETNLHPTANQAHDNLRSGMMFQIFAIKSFFNICQFPNPKRLIDLHEQFSDLISTLLSSI